MGVRGRDVIRVTLHTLLQNIMSAIASEADDCPNCLHAAFEPDTVPWCQHLCPFIGLLFGMVSWCRYESKTKHQSERNQRNVHLQTEHWYRISLGKWHHPYLVKVCFTPHLLSGSLGRVSEHGGEHGQSFPPRSKGHKNTLNIDGSYATVRHLRCYPSQLQAICKRILNLLETDRI